MVLHMLVFLPQEVLKNELMTSFTEFGYLLKLLTQRSL